MVDGSCRAVCWACSTCGACAGFALAVFRAQAFHPSPASVKYGWSGRVCRHKLSNHFRHWLNMDGVGKACRAHTLHPFPVSVKSDGMTDMKCLMSYIYREK